ncbi:Hypothetical predicted protein [Mytilus galloprovincialis]|uniref:C-type lectin domain-containing protein n=1 Tax=Mytilus galloprovincialis TaxID=29158 RepID=A0A8B6BHZ4_MYTGA|nr:Hypothetical predicted protein [Mytilus galloprovincialis]
MCLMAAFYLDNANLQTEHADKEVIRVMRRLGKDGNGMANVATKDLVANAICAGTSGAYLWRPNTEQEAFAVLSDSSVWTGANDFDQDGLYTFDTENSSFAFNPLPFGLATIPSNSKKCLIIYFDTSLDKWIWDSNSCTTFITNYICEYPRRVCP